MLLAVVLDLYIEWWRGKFAHSDGGSNFQRNVLLMGRYYSSSALQYGGPGGEGKFPLSRTFYSRGTMDIRIIKNLDTSYVCYTTHLRNAIMLSFLLRVYVSNNFLIIFFAPAFAHMCYMCCY